MTETYAHISQASLKSFMLCLRLELVVHSYVECSTFCAGTNG